MTTTLLQSESSNSPIQTLLEVSQSLLTTSSIEDLLQVCMRPVLQTQPGNLLLWFIENDSSGHPFWIESIVSIHNIDMPGNPIDGRYAYSDSLFNDLFIAEANQIRIIGDVDSDTQLGESARNRLRLAGIQSTMLVPLITTQQRWLGIIQAVWPTKREFGADVLQVYTILLPQIIAIAENRWLLNRLSLSEENFHSSVAEEIRKTQELYQQILDAIADMVLVKGYKSKIVWANKAFRDYYGMTNDQLRDMIDAPFNEPDYTQQYIKDDAYVYETGQILNIAKEPVTRFDGEVRLFNTLKSPIYDTTGKVIMTVGVSRDSTERQHAELALRESEARFRTLVEHAPEAITVVDLDTGRYIEVNQHTVDLFQYSREELLQMGPANVSPYMQPNGKLSAEAIEERAAETLQGLTPSFEWTYLNGKGVEIPCEIRLVRLPAAGRHLVRGSITDITERKRAQAEREQLISELRHASRVKDEFLANMSHELRTPLNVILGFAQVMQRDSSLTEQQRAHLDIMTRSGEHLLSLINDVLEMSKIEAGRITLNGTPFDLVDVLNNIHEMFAVRAQAKQLQLLFEVSPAIPRYVQADEGKFRQIIINLLGNAIKFTQEGGIVLRAKYDPANFHLIFEIEDTGIGIDEKDLDKLFQPFIQTSSGAKAQEGTGLGLAITRQFIRLMKGDITVHSKVEQGTIFKFDIEVTPVDAAAVETKKTYRKVVGVSPEDKNKYRILIVDDKWENRRLLVEWLQALDLNIKEASDGREALELWEQWAPQLIWMDMRMPGMDGYEATKRIKATLKGQATVIIALTASAFEHEQAVVLSAGCDDFVRKPVRESTVFEKLSEHLGINFIYEEIPLESMANVDEAVVAPDALGSLPHDWLADLRKGIETGDIDLLIDVIRRISTTKPEIAAILSNLVQNYNFEKLESLVQQVK